MLSGYNQLLLEIYKEQTASWKHEDNILYKFGAVLLPVSFAVLGIPYVADVEESDLITLEIVSTIGGIILMTFWCAYVCSTHAKITARFQIIGRIEEHWGIVGHKGVRPIRDKIFKPLKWFPLKTYFLEKNIFYVYWLMALLLTVYRFWDKWTIYKCLAIAYLLLVAFIVSMVVIACIYDRSIRWGERKLKEYSWRGR